MPTTDAIATQPLQPVAVELLARIDAAHAAVTTWPRAFADADVARVRLTLPAVVALSAFLEGHSQEAISIMGTVALEVWSGSDFYVEAGQSFVAGDLANARTKWESGNAAWTHASVPAA
jgi:hypothetical protein